MSSKFYIKQDSKSDGTRIACRLTTDDDPQIQLIPGEWVKVAICTPGLHQLRIGTVRPQGMQKVTLSLQGGTFNGKDKIIDIFHAPTDGSLYEVQVS